MSKKLEELNSQVIHCSKMLSELFPKRVRLGYEIAFKKLEEKNIVPDKPFALKAFKDTKNDESYILASMEDHITYFIENNRVMREEALNYLAIWGYEINNYVCQNKHQTLLGSINLLE